MKRLHLLPLLAIIPLVALIPHADSYIPPTIAFSHIYSGSKHLDAQDYDGNFTILSKGVIVTLANTTHGRTINFTVTGAVQGENLGTHGVGIFSGNHNSTMLDFLKLVSGNSNCSFATNSTNVILTCSGGSSGISSINTDSNAGQILQGTTGNVTVTDNGGGTHTWNLGYFAVVTNGVAQTFNKLVTFASGAVIHGLSLNVPAKKTGNFNIASTDDVIFVDASGGTAQGNLPAANSNVGKVYTIIKNDTSTYKVIIAATGSDTIDNNGSRYLTGQKATMVLISDGGTGGGNYHVISYSSSSDQAYKMRHTIGNYINLAVNNAANSTHTASANTIRAYPRANVERTFTFDSMAIEVWAQPLAGHCRFGIYADNGTEYPGNIVSGTDHLMSPNSTGVVTASVSPTVTLYGGNLYWDVIDCDVAAKIDGIGTGAIPSVIGLKSSDLSSRGSGWSTSLTYPTAGLPTKFPSGAAVLGNSIAISLGIRPID